METSTHRAADSIRRHRSSIHTTASQDASRPSSTRNSHVEESTRTPPVLAGPAPDSTSMMLLHCLFAMVFAAAVMGLLHCLGFVVRSSTNCPAREGDMAGVYSACEIWQDTRSVLSFILGAALCCFMTRNDQPCPPEAQALREADGAEKLQLYACLL
mmetsp:Transcript_107089/g.169241  ORF Transcript_107089/g.169241 Transcript_107089/m.169241 type:complete len:157 (+) Transcript_107089:95-565(+)